MIVKKIKLSNIRSYVNEDIIFPEGNLLLAGNIGSGKSTILLAIDFVLFGLRKGSLSGGSLLRAGSDEGWAELYLDIDGKDVVIKRVLKRGTTISQSSGYILINGVKKELSAMELKQSILNLLNYPQELLTKSKSMIFHYTVYTPQEEMKKVLLGDREIRLDTLRKIFGMDKYKRVKENSKIFLFALRGKINEFHGKIERLDEKEQERLEKENKKKALELNIINAEHILESRKKEVNEKKEFIKKIEAKINELNEIKKQVSIVDVDLRNKVERLDRNKEEIEEITNRLKTIKIEDIKEEDIKDEIKKIEEKAENTEKSLRLILDKINIANVNGENSRKIINSIQRYDVCPTCQQEVKEEYKKKIAGEENNKIIKNRGDIKNFTDEKNDTEAELFRLKKELESLKEKEKIIEINELKRKEVSSGELKRKVIEEEVNKLEEGIKFLNKNKEELLNKIEQSKEIDIEKDKKELEALENEFRETELMLNSYGVELKNLSETIKFLEKEIREMTEVKNNLGYFKQIRDWINDYFINTMETIEKNVMFRIHSDFNSLFQKWFDILVDNENLKINLDKEFGPLITQGGHDLDYLYLSGGEKNAAALAYRLALNQVINNLIMEIKTKDLLILDEPTDGFSEEQLDRMRIVLEELDIKQIILVSHEAKIESFVDNVIRFKKEDNVSRIYDYKTQEKVL